MRIRLVTPAPRGSRAGNRTTAHRWAALLRSLGHSVVVEQTYRSGRADLLIALHARKSHDSVERFRGHVPGGRIVVALTGTDLYVDFPRSAAARRSVQLADRLVVLQPLALERLPAEAKEKARVVLQSAEPPARLLPREGVFELCVVAHLRPVKDPLRAALAVRALPSTSKVQVVHVGRALSPRMEQRALAELKRNPRYRWLGERTRAQTLRLLGRARALVVSSWSEGGANVVSEAIAAGVPVLASDIPGNRGLLGPEYPGYFPAGDTAALTALIRRMEEDPAFARTLQRQVRTLAPRFRPERERAAWRRLLAEL